jgi:hypothetical protein
MNDKKLTKSKLIAVCGMNCGICMAYLREKNKCPGCRGSDVNKFKSVINCRIKNCKELKENNYKFCYFCKKYPCERIKHIDKRYQTKYNMSMIDNFKFIEQNGMVKFLKKERQKWSCPNCGGTLSCHRLICYKCGFKKNK